MGAATTIVGPTGSGKSTLLDVLLGLMEPTSGALRADGHPIEAGELQAWRRNFAYVSQVSVLLDATVAENIAFGVPLEEIDLVRVRDAARVACIDEFIERELPLGYETPVGDRGVRLSGGQRQRVAIARALYTGRPILVLDEATNALDESTEARVLDRLCSRGHDLTLLRVTHRLGSNLQNDAVLKIGGGVVRYTGQSPHSAAAVDEFGHKGNET